MNITHPVMALTSSIGTEKFSPVVYKTHPHQFNLHRLHHSPNAMHACHARAWLTGPGVTGPVNSGADVSQPIPR